MLKDRFLSVFALAFAAGIATPILLGSVLSARGTESKAVSFVVLLCLALIAVGIWFWAHRHMRELCTIWIYPLVFIVGMTLGAGWLWMRSVPYGTYEQYVGREDTVQGTVLESGSSAESTYIELKLERTKAALPIGTRIRLYCTRDRDIRIGDRVDAVLTYSTLPYESQKSNRIVLCANGTVIDTRQGTGLLNAVRTAFLQACEELYSPYGVTGTAQALTVRERTSLSNDVSKAYRNAGLSHLLAISGLHLTIMISALRRLLLFIGMRKRTAECVALAAIAFYCFLTGFSPSIVRASIMLGAVLIGEITFSESDSLTVLFLALTVLLAINPFALLSIGLQLSFLSCLGILLLEPHITELKRKIKGKYDQRFYRLRRITAAFVGSLLVTVSAVVFTFPVTMTNFGTFSYITPFANLVFVPLYSFALSALMLTVVLFPFVPQIAALIAVVPGQILRLSENTLALLCENDIGMFATDSVWVIVPVVFAVLAIAGLLLFYQKGARVYAACTCAFLVSLALCGILLPRIVPGTLIVSADSGYVYAAIEDRGTYLDLGGERETSAKTALTAYIVTKPDEKTLSRLAGVLAKSRGVKVYLPLVSEDGKKNDLSLFKALANQKNCVIIEYYYTVETADMLYSARNGTVETPFETAVLLYGDAPAPDFTRLVLMPAYAGDLSAVPPDALYIPLSYEGDVPSERVHLYDGEFVFSSGEVKKD